MEVIADGSLGNFGFEGTVFDLGQFRIQIIEAGPRQIPLHSQVFLRGLAPSTLGQAWRVGLDLFHDLHLIVDLDHIR